MTYTIKRLSETTMAVTVAGAGTYLADKSTLTITPKTQRAFWCVLYSPCHSAAENASARRIWMHVEGVFTGEFDLPAKTVWEWVRNGSKIPLLG